MNKNNRKHLLILILLTMALVINSCKTKHKVGDLISLHDIEWRILEINRGKALVISENILFERQYHTSATSITWANSSLRAYLNDEFYNSFSASDRNRIVEVNNINEDNQWIGTPGGLNTNDMIFLLSLAEVVKYFGDSGQLANRPNNNTWWIDDQFNSNRIATFNGTASWWWLRSPGADSISAYHVNYDGSIYSLVGNVRSSGGVRPALWLNL